MVQKGLWILVIVAMLASLPLSLNRMNAENSAPQVDIVADYQDLFTIAHYQAHPEQYLDEQLLRLKEAGVTSIALYESTLNDLEMQRRLQYFTSAEMAALEYRPFPIGENYTYIRFTTSYFAERLKPMIVESFEARGVEVSDWRFRGDEGLVIAQPAQEASIQPMNIDPIALEDIAAKGFYPAVRLSDNRPFDLDRIDRQLQRLSGFGVRWIIFSGSQVTGVKDDAEQNSLTAMAELMNRYGIGMATIEMLNVPQQGLPKLAYLTDYRVARLHSIVEGETSLPPEQLANRMELAVTDRNIRMIYLNAQISRDASKAEVKNTISNLLQALTGADGAVQSITDAGYSIGQAEPFSYEPVAADKLLRLIVLIGLIALVALMLSKFVPRWTLLLFMTGLIGSAALYLAASQLLLQLAALAGGVSAAALAGITVIQQVSAQQKRQLSNEAPQRSKRAALQHTVLLFLQALGISLIGVLLITGLLNQITYMLVIEQFRGVTALKLAPIVIAAAYYMLFIRLPQDAERHQRSRSEQLKSWFHMPVRLSYVIVFGALALIGMYYLSRAGNQGQTLPFEPLLRSMLEEGLGVRPRTQEFLIGHPLLIMGAYFALRYRKGMILIVFGVLGQLTMIGTFTHLHTPWDVSALRSIYGALFGLLNGMIGLFVLEGLRKGWQKWNAKKS